MTTGTLLDAPLYSLNNTAGQNTLLVSEFASSLSSYGATPAHSSPAAKLFAPAPSMQSAMDAELQGFHSPHRLDHRQLAYYQQINAQQHADHHSPQQCMSAQSLALSSGLLPIPGQLAPAASSDSLCRSLSASSDASSHLLFQSPLLSYPSAPPIATPYQDAYQPISSAPHPLSPQLHTMISPRPQHSFLALVDTPPSGLATAYSHSSPGAQVATSPFSHASPAPHAAPSAFAHPSPGRPTVGAMSAAAVMTATYSPTSVAVSSPQAAFPSSYPAVSSALPMLPVSYAIPHAPTPQALPITPQQVSPVSNMAASLASSPAPGVPSWAPLGNPALPPQSAPLSSFVTPAPVATSTQLPSSPPCAQDLPAAAATYPSPATTGPAPTPTPPAAGSSPAPANVSQPPPPPPARTQPAPPNPPAVPVAAPASGAAPAAEPRAAAEKPQEAPKQPPSRCKSGLVPGQDISLLDYFFNPQYNPIATHGRNLIRY